MIHITKQDILKLAKISQLSIHEDEIEPTRKQLQDLLSYAARVEEIAWECAASISKNANVVRADVVIRTDSEPLLALAPETEEHYFVVPKIIESK